MTRYRHRFVPDRTVLRSGRRGTSASHFLSTKSIVTIDSTHDLPLAGARNILVVATEALGVLATARQPIDLVVTALRGHPEHDAKIARRPYSSS